MAYTRAPAKGPKNQHTQWPASDHARAPSTNDTTKGKTQQVREIFKVIKIKDLQSRLLYPAKLPFRILGQIKSFPDKKKLKEFITTKPVLSEMLKELL